MFLILGPHRVQTESYASCVFCDSVTKAPAIPLLDAHPKMAAHQELAAAVVHEAVLDLRDASPSVRVSAVAEGDSARRERSLDLIQARVEGFPAVLLGPDKPVSSVSCAHSTRSQLSTCSSVLRRGARIGLFVRESCGWIGVPQSR